MRATYLDDDEKAWQRIVAIHRVPYLPKPERKSKSIEENEAFQDSIDIFVEL